MPAKPAWYSRINDMIRQLEALPRPFVDRATVEFLLGVGRRRAQQILAPCITDRVGTNGLADRDAFIAHLRRLAEGEAGYYERQRRQKVAAILTQLNQDHLEAPVPAAVRIPVVPVPHQALPGGVTFDGGRMIVPFTGAEQLLSTLYAVAQAAAADFEGFRAAAEAASSPSPAESEEHELIPLSVPRGRSAWPTPGRVAI